MSMDLKIVLSIALVLAGVLVLLKAVREKKTIVLVIGIALAAASIVVLYI